MTKKTPKADIGAKLNEMAAEIMDAAMSAQGADAVPLETKVDVFKAVSAYYLGVSKVKVKEPDEAPNANFGEFRRKIELASSK